MELYLLKSAACLAFLLLFYKLLLEKESIHVFKRFYLLAAVIVAGIIPLIAFQTYIEAAPMLQGEEIWLRFSEAPSETTSNWMNTFIWIVYLSGVILSGGKFLRNLFIITGRIRKNPKVQIEKVSGVLLSENLPPHTFWKYIFLNKQKFQKGQIPKEVLEHEKAHATQKHSLDILFFELLQIILWFNPLIYLTKKAVKLNHEFLADNAVLRQGANTASYQELLLTFSSRELQSSITNSINYSLIKKRFTVMTTRTSKRTSALKGFLLIPLLAGLLYSFSTKEVLLVENSSQKGELVQNELTQEKKLSLFILGEKEIFVNGRKTGVRGFADLVDKATEDWTTADYELHGLEIRISDGVSENLIDRLNAEFKKTKLAEYLNSDSPYIRPFTNLDAPSPPVPPLPKEGDVPLPPPPPPAPENIDVPAPPPPPPSPVEALEKWMEEGAEFFYNGKAVSGQEALEAVQKNDGKNLSVNVQENNGSKTVRISDNKR